MSTVATTGCGDAEAPTPAAGEPEVDSPPEHDAAAPADDVAGDRASDAAPDAELAFELGPSTRLHRAHMMAGAAVFTRSGSFRDLEPSHALVIVSRSPPSPDETDRRAYAEGRLCQSALVDDLRGVEHEEIELDGLVGIETSAVGAHQSDALEIYVVQALLFESDGGHWLVQARVAADERATWEPEFRGMLEGFRRTKGGD